jgi:hypothetical protein
MHLSSIDSIVCLQQSTLPDSSSMDVRLVHFIMCSNLATRRLRKPLSRDHRIWLAPAMSTQALGRRAIWVDFSPSSYDTAQKRSPSGSAMHLGYGCLIPLCHCCLSGPAAKAERDRRTHCNKPHADSGSCTSLPHESAGSSLAFLHGLRRPQIHIQFPALWR